MHPKTHGIQAFSDSPCSRWTNKTLVVSTFRGLNVHVCCRSIIDLHVCVERIWRRCKIIAGYLLLNLFYFSTYRMVLAVLVLLFLVALAPTRIFPCSSCSRDISSKQYQ